MKHPKIKKIHLTDEFKQDFAELVKKIDNEKNVRDMFEGVSFHLERNSEMCPCYNDTNIKYYEPRQIRNLPRIKILFIESNNDITLCAIVSEDD